MNDRQFKKLFDEMYKPLGMYALRLIGDVAEAEDAVQEAFASVWDKLSDGGEIGAMKPYLFRAVKNAALMRLRSTGRCVSIESVEYDSVTDGNEAAEVSDEAVWQAERDAALWKEVDRLPRRCRDVFLRCKRDGSTYAEVAQELGITVKTVENQMNKALGRLRAALKF